MGEKITITDVDNTVELDISIETADLPSKGDAQILSRVVSHGFSGHQGGWIEREVFQRFCRDIAALERTRKGEATLVSMSPGELMLHVSSTDNQGHMAVKGNLASLESRRRFGHSLEFGFDFEPIELEALAASLSALLEE